MNFAPTVDRWAERFDAWVGERFGAASTADNYAILYLKITSGAQRKRL